jgi:hypothetical protein
MYTSEDLIRTGAMNKVDNGTIISRDNGLVLDKMVGNGKVMLCDYYRRCRKAH